MATNEHMTFEVIQTVGEQEQFELRLKFENGETLTISPESIQSAIEMGGYRVAQVVTNSRYKFSKTDWEVYNDAIIDYLNIGRSADLPPVTLNMYGMMGFNPGAFDHEDFDGPGHRTLQASGRNLHKDISRITPVSDSRRRFTTTSYGKIVVMGEGYRDTSTYTKRLNNKRKGSRARTVFPGMSPIRAWGEVESIYAKPYRRVVRYYNGTVYVSGQTGGLVLSENRIYDHVMRGLTKQAPSGASMRKKAKYRSRIVNTFWTHDPLAKLSRSLLESRDAARALMQSDNITYGYDARKEELANLLSPQFTGKPPKRHKFDPTLDDDKTE